MNIKPNLKNFKEELPSLAAVEQFLFVLTVGLALLSVLLLWAVGVTSFLIVGGLTILAGLAYLVLFYRGYKVEAPVYENPADEIPVTENQNSGQANSEIPVA